MRKNDLKVDNIHINWDSKEKNQYKTFHLNPILSKLIGETIANTIKSVILKILKNKFSTNDHGSQNLLKQINSMHNFEGQYLIPELGNKFENQDLIYNVNTKPDKKLTKVTEKSKPKTK